MTRPSTPTCAGSASIPPPITGGETVAALIDNAFLAYNAGRLREACALFTQRMLEPDVTVGMTLTGAMTPAGLGMSCLIPLMEAGFVDWIISTGANLYHDAHFALGLADAPRHPQRRRRGAARQGRGPDLRHLLRLRRAALDRRLHPRSVGARGVPAADEQRRIPLSARRLRPRARAGARAHPAGRYSPPRTSSKCRSTPARRATAPSA